MKSVLKQKEDLVYVEGWINGLMYEKDNLVHNDIPSILRDAIEYFDELIKKDFSFVSNSEVKKE